MICECFVVVNFAFLTFEINDYYHKKDMKGFLIDDGNEKKCKFAYFSVDLPVF